MRDYLIATGRAPVAKAADEAASRGFLEADKNAEYDEVISIVWLFNVSPELELKVAAEPFGPGTYYQWTVHTGSCHPVVEVRLGGTRTRVEG